MRELDVAIARLGRAVAQASVGPVGRAVAVPTTAQGWSRALAMLEGQRLTGLALVAADERRITLDDGRFEELAGRHTAWMHACLQREQLLCAITDTLAEHGIDPVVLKGPAFAHRFYPDPSWRPFGDLDLLVRSADWPQACAVLARLGMLRQRPEPRRGFEQRFGKAAVHRTPDGIEVDLHRTLVVGPFGLWLDLDALHAATTPLPLGGRTLRRLDDTASWLHACLHAALGLQPHLLLPVRDLWQIDRTGAVDPDRLAGWIHDWRLAVVVRHAARLVAVDLGQQLHAAGIALDRLTAGRRDQRLLEAYTTPRRRRGGTALATVHAIPGVRAKAAYVTALAAPRREFARARHGDGPGAYLRRWTVAARWLQRSWS